MRGRVVAGWTAANTIVLVAALFPVLWTAGIGLQM